MNREYIKRVMSTILEKFKINQSDTSSIVNSLDDHGCSLLHYVAALNYHEIVNLLHEYGADLSLKTGSNSGGENMTPLMIAAAKGY